MMKTTEEEEVRSSPPNTSKEIEDSEHASRLRNTKNGKITLN